MSRTPEFGSQAEPKDAARKLGGAKISPVPAEWQAYNAWYGKLSSVERWKARSTGKFPDNTPPRFKQLFAKTAPEDMVLFAAHNNYPEVEEVLSKTAQETKRKEEPNRKLAEQADLELFSAQADFVMANLTERERLVVSQRFGLEDGRFRTQTEVGQAINRSPRTVRRVEKSALSKLRSPSLGNKPI